MYFSRCLHAAQRLTNRGINDAKAGTHVGTDQFGNRYFENLAYGEEVPGVYKTF